MTPLSPRETEVLALIATGLSSKQIARRLGIKYGTVKNHVLHILAKLNAANRAHAVALVSAEMNGLSAEPCGASLDTRPAAPARAPHSGLNTSGRTHG
jgi:DNA-binding CsgD family transcriptional regulator